MGQRRQLSVCGWPAGCQRPISCGVDLGRVVSEAEPGKKNNPRFLASRRPQGTGSFAVERQLDQPVDKNFELGYLRSTRGKAGDASESELRVFLTLVKPVILASRVVYRQLLEVVSLSQRRTKLLRKDTSS